MKKPKYHIFVCTSSRLNGLPVGFCHSKGGADLIVKFTDELEDRDLGSDVVVSNTGCLSFCEKGPVVIVYPDNVWYGGVTIDDVDAIIEEHIEGGIPVARLELKWDF